MNSNNSNNMTATQIGSVTRVTVGGAATHTAAPSSISLPPQETNRVGSGALRFAVGGGEVIQSGVTRHSTFHDRNISTVAATLQRINGHDTVELIPGMAGSRTHVKTAINDGLIIPMGNGQYQDRSASNSAPTAQAAAPAAAAPEAAPVDPGQGVFSPAEDEDWNAAIEPLPQHSFDSAAASITAAILSGSNNLDRAATQLAESAGIEPALAAQYVQEGYEMHERIVAREAAALGVTDKAGFYAWMQEHKVRGLQNAVQSLSAARNVQPFRVLALEYARYSSEQASKMRPSR